jgi:hypothetical protein
MINAAIGVDGSNRSFNVRILPFLKVEIGSGLFHNILMRNTKPRLQFRLRVFDALHSVFLRLDTLLNGFCHEKGF